MGACCNVLFVFLTWPWHKAANAFYHLVTRWVFMLFSKGVFMLRLRDFHISNFVSMEVKVHGASLSQIDATEIIWSLVLFPKNWLRNQSDLPSGNDHISPNSRHFWMIFRTSRLVGYVSFLEVITRPSCSLGCSGATRLCRGTKRLRRVLIGAEVWKKMVHFYGNPPQKWRVKCEKTFKKNFNKNDQTDMTKWWGCR